MIYRIVIMFFLFFSVFNVRVIAQETVKTAQETQLEQKAFTLFKEDKFSEALPLFSQLLSLFPKEPNYNFGYAVCLIETNQQIEKSIKYLQFADSKSDNPLIKFYLGRAFHLSYKFDEALNYYDLYSKKALPADKKKYLLDSKIAMCKNGKELIKYISDLAVVDNKKIKSENYYYSYELNDYGGKLIIKPPEFKSKLDKKLESSNTVVFFPSSGTEAYFGSYGDNKSNGKDIYKITKLPDGKWGKPENLGTVINTQYDEDFPFFSNDGKLYFSSKGHNSMGGFDIFKSEFDTTSKKWLTPINLDFPINTPYDDYLYIPDKDEKYAFFASNRETNGDNISVYKIVVDKNPIKREFNNIDEVINTSKLEVSSLAEIQKAENSHNKLENKLQSNNVNENNNLQNTNNFIFKPITYSQNLTTQQISSEVAKDEEIINEQSKTIRKQSNLAYLSAIDKNNKANEKRQLASAKTEQLINTTDNSKIEQKKQEIFDLITDAENLEKDAVTAYNIAKNLDQIAADIEKDVAKTKNIKEAINNADNSNNQSLVEIANKNKELLNNSQNKYTNLENEIINRNNLAEKKQVDLLQNQKLYQENQDNIAKIENEISELQKQIENELNNEQKLILSEKIENKNKLLDKYNEQDSTLQDNYDKAKLETENLQSEVSFLKQISNSIKTDKRSSQDIATLTKNINKEQLHKEIFEKELDVDIKNANTVLQNNQQNNNLVAINNNVKSINETNQNTNNNKLSEEQVKNLYTQAERNNKIVDSLQNVITNKEKVMSTITDQNKHAEAFNEIVQLNDIKEIKRKQNEEILKQAKANDKNLVVKNNSNAYQNNSVFPFNKDNQNNQDSKLVAYQKELLNTQYYENIIKEQHNQLEILNNSINNTSDANAKLSIEKQIAELNKQIVENNKIKDQSKLNAEKLHEDAVSEIDTNSITNEQLVLNATQYKLKSEINYSNDQKQILSLVENDRNLLKSTQKKYNEITAEIADLTKKSETSDATTKKQIEKEIINKREKQNELVTKYSIISKESNSDLASIYKDVIDANKKIDFNNPDVRLANMLDKEAEIYFEKALNVRKDADLLTKSEEIQKEYQKADNLEQIAIQKQKYSIDLFVKSKIDLTANNNDNSIVSNSQNVIKSFNSVSPDTNLVPQTIQITLNPDEENQLKTFRQDSHKADVMLAEANKILTDVETKRTQAANTFSTSEKQQILKGVDVKEQKAYDQLMVSYNTYGKADSMKYVVYKNQITMLQNASKEIGNNKSIAKQYTNEADFYFEEANRIRTKAKNTTDKTQKAEELKRATDFEKKALSSQEFAVDVLTDVNPVFFVSTNELTKVDRLDVLNQPVNVDDIVHVKTSRIISKLSITEDELKKLDEVEKKRSISSQLLKDADVYNKSIDSLQKIVSMPTNSKEKKKAEKQIAKLEKKMFASQFTSAEIDESVNDARFYLYKDYFKKTRLNDNTQEARQGKQLEKDSNTKYSKAKSLREKAFMKEDARKAFEYTVQAKKLEVEAIEDQERAYGIYLNLKPLEDELKEYALLHPAKNTNSENNLIVKSTANITPIETIIDTTELIANNQIENNNQPTNNIQNNIIENNNITNVTENNNVEKIDTIPNKIETKIDTTQKTNVIIENNTNQIDTLNNNVQPNAIDTVIKTNIVELNNNIEKIDTAQKIISSNKTNNQTNNNIKNVDNSQAVNNQNLLSDNSAVNEALNKQGFGFSNLPVNAYSNANPIPMNMPLPDGIVFKVQIGAFKSPVKNETFKGLNPISGETLEGSQYVRYYVGLFYSEDAATIVRDQIKPIGYKDAFIVAYKDGKKITLFEARRLLKEQGEVEKYELLTQAEVNKIKNRVSNNDNNLQNISNIVNDNKVVVNNTNTIQIKATVNSTDVTATSGLFYTVQIGVYKTPVSSQDLKNLSPIYEEHAYGFIRYTTGKYNDFKNADIEKNRIVQLGITDAFVSAYYNGKRLSVADALKISIQNKDVKSDQVEVKYPEQQIDNTQNNLKIVKDSIVFKVQIGSFKEQVPVEKVTRYIELASNYGLNQERDESGATVYFIGKLKTYDEALQLRDVLINEGEKDAFIVAFSGKQKISINDAKKILNQ